MNKDTFWNIIEISKNEANGNNEELTVLLKNNISKLSTNDLLHFQFIYEVYEIIVISSTSHLIWNALFLINNGYCTDTYGFAGWLISNGKQAFLNAFKDVETLVDLDAKKDKCNYEDLRFLAARIYKEGTGTKIKAYNKILNEFWCLQTSKLEKEEIESEVIYGGVKRNANWKLDDLKLVLPKLYKKHISETE